MPAHCYVSDGLLFKLGHYENDHFRANNLYEQAGASLIGHLESKLAPCSCTDAEKTANQ